MAIKLNIKFLRNIKRIDSLNQTMYEFEEGFLSNVQYLNEYFEKSYLDKYSRFFLLLKIRERFFEEHKFQLDKYSNNAKSIFYLIFYFRTFNNWKKTIEFEVKEAEDLILYISIYLDFLLFESIENIVYSTNVSKYVYKSKIKDSILIENDELLNVLPCIFSPMKFKEVLQNEILNADKTNESGYNLGTDIFVIANKINHISKEFKNRSLLRLSRNYNYREYELLISELTDKQEKYIINYTYEIENIRYFVFDKNFILDLPKEFEIEFLKKNDLKNYSVPIISYDKTGAQNPSKIKSQFVNNLYTQKTFKNKLKIEIEGKLALKVFECFLKFHIGESRTKNILPQFNKLIKYLQNEDEQHKPIIKDFSAEELKYLIGFMSSYKSNRNSKSVFTYKVNDLIDLLIDVFNFNENAISRKSLDKAHRDQSFKITKDMKSCVNSIF